MIQGTLSLREQLASSTSVVFQATKGHQRHYEVEFKSKHGGLLYEGERTVSTRIRGKVLAVILFRKWFGHGPSRIEERWGTAWAEDRRGNLVIINQVNNYSVYPMQRGLLLSEHSEASIMEEARSIHATDRQREVGLAPWNELPAQAQMAYIRRAANVLGIPFPTEEAA